MDLFPLFLFMFCYPRGISAKPTLDTGQQESVGGGRRPPPSISLLQMQSDEPLAANWTTIDLPANSAVVIGGDHVPLSSQVRLECFAGYPVQWVYEGDGTPEYSSHLAQKPNHTRPGPAGSTFQASIHLGVITPLGPQNSGRYICRGVQSTDASPPKAYYQIYVDDGKNLFVRKTPTHPIYYRPSDHSVRIPCSVTNPATLVSLQKSQGGMVQCPLNQSISFDPAKGFRLKVSSYFDPAGPYLCTAGLNGRYQLVQYNLVKDDPKPARPSDGAPQQIQQHPSAGQTAAGTMICIRNSDCPASEACLNSRCGSPCGSVCGRNTKCDVVGHVPRCHCLPHHGGDPYRACAPLPTTPPENLQTDPCSPNPCGQNTVCERHGSVARCVCRPGFQGDPYHRCSPPPRDPCNPNPCGKYSECKSSRHSVASCRCKSGFVGRPPYCRPECSSHRHCPSDRACLQHRCRNPCEGACDKFPLTRCRVIDRRAVCATVNCPPGIQGTHCRNSYPKHELQSNNSLGEEWNSPCDPSPCGIGADCKVWFLGEPQITHYNRRLNDYNITYYIIPGSKTPIDVPMIYQVEAVRNPVLNTSSELALCSCPPDWTGNADLECFPMEEKLFPRDGEPETTPLGTEITASAIAATEGTSALDAVKNFTREKTTKDCREVSNCSQSVARGCGINAISVVGVDGGSSCMCPAGYSGIATIFCHKNGEKLLSTQHNSPGREKCSQDSDCGENEECKEDGGSFGRRCQCIVGGFEPQQKGGGCLRLCKTHADCPPTHVCLSAGVNKCVNPCDWEHRPTLARCGRGAECLVTNHIPSCVCPQAMPIGDPKVQCTQTTLTPPTKQHCSSEKLSCGTNATCRKFHDLIERCVCLPGFHGDPATGCQAPLYCKQNEDCPPEKALCVAGECRRGCSIIMDSKSGECEAAKGALAERFRLLAQRFIVNK